MDRRRVVNQAVVQDNFMTSHQINQFDQPESEDTQPIAAHFHDLMKHCDATLTPMLTELAAHTLEIFPKECQEKAVESGKFQEWHLLEETISAVEQFQSQVISRFSSNLSSAFNQFIHGETIYSEYSEEDDEDIDSQLQSLSLIDNDELEISVLITTITTASSQHYTDQLYALGRRLAMISHGNLIDDQDKSFLLGPAQLCYAFLDALQIAQIELYGEQVLFTTFHQHVINQLDAVYVQFNELLAEAGILPNIRYGSREKRATAEHFSAQAQQLQEDADTETLEQYAAELEENAIQPQSSQPNAGHSNIQSAAQQDIVQGIMSLLTERRELQVGSGQAVPPQRISRQQVLQRRDHLVSAIGTMQQTLAPTFLTDTNNFSLEAARSYIQQQTAQISEEVAKTQPDTADADLIDMVGMLFEYILNDNDLPDNIKALLCHLHTPYLKVALLDRQFFMQTDHPARLLLDALSKAGVYCDASNRNSLNIVTKIREVVKRVLDEFDKEPKLFEELVEDFNAAIETINRRHAVVEKRAIDAAKGQQKIKLARETVSTAVIERLIKHPQIPKVMESLLMGSWGNYLMITILRNGESSPEWEGALKLTDELIWSVEPKRTAEERKELTKHLARIVAETRAAIDLSGNSETERDTLITKLQKCHELVLLGYYTRMGESEKSSNVEAKRLSSLKRILPEEWKDSLREKKKAAKISAEIKELFSVGTRIELSEADSEKAIRGRIAWVNEEHTQCLLVNEAGKQIAIQSVEELNQLRLDGTLKILKNQDQPLFDRALSWIQERIRQDTKVAVAT